MRVPVFVAVLFAAGSAFAQNPTPPAISDPPAAELGVNDPVRDGFIREGTKSCIATLGASPSQAKLGLTDTAVSQYCTCTVGHMFDEMTAEEFQEIVTTKQVPESLKERGRPFAASCMQEAVQSQRAKP